MPTNSWSVPARLANAAVLLARLVAVHDGRRHPAHAPATRPVRAPRRRPQWSTIPCTRTSAMEPKGVVQVLVQRERLCLPPTAVPRPRSSR